MRNRRKVRHDRIARRSTPSLQPVGEGPPHYEGKAPKRNAVVDCGWGRLIFAHTFADPKKVADVLRQEAPGKRDVAFYLRDPHVVLAMAPQELFLDPSHTFRLWLNEYRPARRPPSGFIVAPVNSDEEMAEIDRIYLARGMVPVDPDFPGRRHETREVVYLLAREEETGQVIGTVMGVDHKRAFDDPENGSSLWSLAVDPQTSHPGVGEALVRQLAERFQARGRSFMDLSVLHDNNEAIALYEKLGFRRIPAFTVKTRSSINEKLYIGPDPDEGLNPYARIITNEARRRGIAVEVVDAEAGYFRLVYGGRAIVCRESLSELTSAIAMSRCDDKAVTRRLLAAAGLSLPAQRKAGKPSQNRAFLKEHESVVVKPARGEQGAGVRVDLRDPDEVEDAVAAARQYGETVLLEQYVAGEDLRIVVIGDAVVAGAVRRPPEVTGTGRHTIRELIERQSRRRAAATGGESRIPLDAETERCVRAAGHAVDTVLEPGATVAVRKTANLHTGGTIHDVTDRMHPALSEAAVAAARALDIPVVGLDFLVPSVEQPDYVIIEANERPGLANHEPQPTAQRFVDLLFPQTVVRVDRATTRESEGTPA